MDARQSEGTKASSAGHSAKGLISRLLDEVGNVQAPHGYFGHFYVLSVLSSVFWGFQIISQGSTMKSVASMADKGSHSTSMSMDRIILLWSFLLLQGMRRLMESIFVFKTSASKMWFVHYLLGMGFYLVAGIAVWIEGGGRSI